MKINYRVFKTLTGEPFLTQTIDGKEVGFYKMNETNFLQENVSRGRFYLWTSDGNTYKLLVEEGFYNKVSYFFAEEVNAIWINFLNEVSAINSKTSKMFLFGSLGISLAIITLAVVLEKFIQTESNFMTFGIIGALLVTMIGNMVHSSKVNKVVREKNLNAQNEIRNILTENKFNQLLKDQEEYMREYFEFKDDEDFEDEDFEEVVATEETLELDNTDLELTLEEEEAVEEIIAEIEPIVEQKIKETSKVDYNTNTVAQLKEMAKDRGLVGYSALKKAEVIKMLEEDDNK